MLPQRVRRQLAAAFENPRAIIGGGFVKIPAGATEHYAAWANSMDDEQVGVQHMGVGVRVWVWVCGR